MTDTTILGSDDAIVRSEVLERAFWERADASAVSIIRMLMLDTCVACGAHGVNADLVLG
jgi:hypothetical protein